MIGFYSGIYSYSGGWGYAYPPLRYCSYLPISLIFGVGDLNLNFNLIPTPKTHFAIQSKLTEWLLVIILTIVIQAVIVN